MAPYREAMTEYTQAALESAATTEETDDVIVASDDAEIIADTDGEDDVEERPDDCACGEFHRDTALPCWPCYREGFETVASE